MKKLYKKNKYFLYYCVCFKILSSKLGTKSNFLIRFDISIGCRDIKNLHRS